jgi:hypothetical protein
MAQSKAQRLSVLRAASRQGSAEGQEEPTSDDMEKPLRQKRGPSHHYQLPRWYARGGHDRGKQDRLPLKAHGHRSCTAQHTGITLCLTQ